MCLCVFSVCESKYFVVVVSSFQLLNSLQSNRVPSILLMRTKPQGNEVILSTYYHSNLIRTTSLLIEFLLSKFKTKNQLSYNIYYKTHSQLYIRPTINHKFQTCATFNNYCTIIVALSNHFQCSFPLLYSSIHSITLQNSTKLKSAFSVKPFQIPMQNEYQF